MPRAQRRSRCWRRRLGCWDGSLCCNLLSWSRGTDWQPDVGAGTPAEAQVPLWRVSHVACRDCVRGVPQLRHGFYGFWKQAIKRGYTSGKVCATCRSRGWPRGPQRAGCATADVWRDWHRVRRAALPSGEVPRGSRLLQRRNSRYAAGLCEASDVPLMCCMAPACVLCQAAPPVSSWACGKIDSSAPRVRHVGPLCGGPWRRVCPGGAHGCRLISPVS